MKTTALRAALTMICASIILLSGCGSNPDSLEAIFRSGVVTVLVASGEPESAEAKITRAIAEDLGVSVELEEANSNDMLEEFARSGAHLAIGQIPLTDSLRQVYAASVSYATGRLYAVTPRGVYFPTADAFSQKTVGVTARLSPVTDIAVSGVPEIKKIVCEEGGAENLYHTVSESLKSGAFAAFLCYRDEALKFLEQPDLQVQNLLGIEDEQYVAVAQKADGALIARVNNIITRLLESGEI